MDSLFIMQRYWGSDEEDNDEGNRSNSNAEISHEIKRKKANSFINEKEQISFIKKPFEADNDNEIQTIAKNTICADKITDYEMKIPVKKKKKGKSLEIKKKESFSKELNITDSLAVENKCKNNSNIDLTHSKKDLKSTLTYCLREEENKGENKSDSNSDSADIKNEINKKKRTHSFISESRKNTLVETALNSGDSDDIKIITENTVSVDKTDEEKVFPNKGGKCKSIEVKKNDYDLKEVNLSSSVDAENVENFSTIGQANLKKNVKVIHTLPHWLCNPTYIGINLQEEITPIAELNFLDSNSKKNLEEAGINFLFPVQLAVIPWLMQSKEQSLLIRPSDICVSAPTGSGKTLAFVLPIVQSLKDRVVCAIRALVVLPVSELAIQVFKIFETFVRGTDLKVALLTGQKSFIAEQNALIKSNGLKIQSLVDIVVTTPGRICDHIYRTKGFCLKRLQYLVIDEADRMLEEIQRGWLKQVEDAVFNCCAFDKCACQSLNRVSYEPSSAYKFGFVSQPLQKLLYSATLTHDPEQLHSLCLYKPKLFTASSSSSSDEHLETCAIPPGLTMLQIVCDGSIKPMVICQFIKSHNFKRVLCFTETIDRAHRLHLVLEEMGLLQVREISSFNRAVQRKIVLEQFSSGKIDILVCSDLVARGIDIENVDCVISYDVPQSIKIYIHRIGRTARAGKTGTAVTLLTDGEIPHFKKILQSVGIKLPPKVNLNSADLESLVNCYQNALKETDAKLKNEKNQLPGRLPKKRKINK